MAGDVGLVAKALTPIIEWVFGEEGMAQWQKQRLMKQRDEIAQGMLKHARTEQDWDALRVYVNDTLRLSREP